MTDITSGVRTAVSAMPQRSQVFVVIAFPGYTARLWDGVGDKVLGGDTYVGAGDLGSVGAISDSIGDTTIQFNSERLELTLTGLNTNLAASLRNIQHAGSPITVLEAQLDADGNIIADEYDLFVGVVDTMSVELGQYMTITLTAENFLGWLFRGVDGRIRGDADQQEIFSGDLGFQYSATQNADIPWAIAVSVPTNGASAARGPFPLLSALYR